MLQDWFDYCGFSEEESVQASLGLSRLKDALHPNANFDTASNWEILEAAHTVLGRIKSRWAQKILYIWAAYYDFLEENPDSDPCDVSWFTAGEHIGAWPTEAEYPASFEELFEDFVTSEWFGAERTRINVRSILRTLARLFGQINQRHNSVDDLIKMSPATWRQIEGALEIEYTPDTAALYLNIYRDLFRYIVSMGWRAQPPFEHERRGSRQVSRERAIDEFWGALVDTSRDIADALTVDELISIEENPDKTELKASLIREWVPQVPTYDLLDAVILIMELPSPFAKEMLGFTRIRSVLDHILNMRTMWRR